MRHKGSRWLFGSILLLGVLQAAVFAVDQIPTDRQTGSPLLDLFWAAWLICR